VETIARPFVRGLRSLAARLDRLVGRETEERNERRAQVGDCMARPVAATKLVLTTRAA
jgi:hypothetical protein